MLRNSSERRVWLACLIGIACAACSGEPGERNLSPARLRPEPALRWQSASLALESDGRSAPWSFALPAGPRAFAVRSALDPAAESGSACFSLEEVEVQAGRVWVGRATIEDLGDYCTSCPERVAVGAGYGLAILPSGAEDALDLGGVTLRVALRDCTTLTPLSAADAGVERVQVEQTSWRPPADDLPLSLPIAVVVATEHGFAGDDGLLGHALSRLQHTWSAVGIEITTAAQVAIAPAPAPIAYGPDDRSQLIALTRAAHAALDEREVSRAWPVFVLTSCLRRGDPISHGRTEPLALTPHVPGGFGLNSEPDLILVAAERCTEFSPGPRFLDPDTLGAVLAHELGHYLGLFHVIEQDGRPDNLSDTSPDRPNLMEVMPSPDALTLTDGQIHIVRRHAVFADGAR